MSRRTAKAKPVEATPAEQAFAVAERLAPAVVRRWLITGEDSTEQRNNDTGAIYRALTLKGQDPQDALQKIIAEQITDRNVEIEANDLVNAVFNSATDAGYLYGLAVGLITGRGGVR